MFSGDSVSYSFNTCRPMCLWGEKALVFLQQESFVCLRRKEEDSIYVPTVPCSTADCQATTAGQHMVGLASTASL